MKMREMVTRSAASSLRIILVAVLAFGGLFTLTSQATAQTTKTCPPLTQGYWKNHTSVWAKQTLTLGTTSYKQPALETILTTPVGGDASLILSDQLIAALLNLMVTGTDSTSVAKTIADANTLLGVGPIPEGVDSSSTLGQEMIADATTLNNFNNGAVTQACGTPVVTGSCQPSSSLSVLVSGTNVVSYVPKGAWSSGTTGVSVVNVEGTGVTNTPISTGSTVNSCASDPLSNQTVCTANNNSVYVISGTSISNTLTSAGTGFISFSGGSCTNCGVAMDASHSRAVIGLSLAGAPGFQFLDLSTSPPTFATPFTSPSGAISEDPLIDPIRNLMLSATERSNYEIVDVSTTTPAFYEHTVSPFLELDSSGEDCSTGIALGPAEFSAPSQVFIADLTQITKTAGSPGTWTAPSQNQSLSESFLAAGASGTAVAQGTHIGVVSGEFGGNTLTAIALPTASGSGTPAITDWVTCAIAGFSNGLDPHTVTAYQSPNGGDAIALLANGGATTLARVDLTMMLNTTTVPRTTAGHGCASGTLPSTVVSFIAVP